MGAIERNLEAILASLAHGSFLLLLILCEVFSEAIAASENEVFPSLTTGATCGIGNVACPTKYSLETSDLPFSLEDSASTLSLDSTVSTPLELQETFTTSPTKVATTPKPTTLPTTTLAPSETVNHEQIKGYAQSRTCSCDLTVQYCDINCCCDPECSDFQRTSFSHCKVVGYPPYDNRYCYISKLTFLNNSEHILQQSQNGAFCIVRSNLAGSVLYPSHSIFSTNQDFIKHWDRAHSPAWPDPLVLNFPFPEKPRSYSAGALVWVLLQNQIQPLYLPSSGLTPACSTLKAVQYLVPWSSKCVHRTQNTESKCEGEHSFIFNQIQNIVKSPLLVNHTQLLSGEIGECSPKVCAPVTYFQCSSLFQSNILSDCVNIPFQRNSSNSRSSLCYNVAKKLRLEFFHNGTAGVDHVKVYMWLTNISHANGSRPNPFYQSLAVDFSWVMQDKTAKEIGINSSTTNVTNTTSETFELPLTRSGNPGYIVGKPVIAGFKVKQKPPVNSTKENDKEAKLSTYEMVELSHDPLEWVTLPLADSDGRCDWSEFQRHIVTFGEDLHLSCGVVITRKNMSTVSSCSALRSKMLHLLMGGALKSFNYSMSHADWGRVVAAFGSANVSSLDGWIPFLSDNQLPLWPEVMSAKSSVLGDTASLLSQTCESVPVGIQLQFMYGLAGTVSNPQSRILGAFARFSTLQDIGWTCYSESCFQGRETKYVRVVSTVRFLDISSPAVTKFAEPPAIHIRLPPDFFYPFMAAEGSSSLSIHRKPLLTIAVASTPLFISVFQVCVMLL